MVKGAPPGARSRGLGAPARGSLARDVGIDGTAGERQGCGLGAKTPGPLFLHRGRLATPRRPRCIPGFCIYAVGGMSTLFRVDMQIAPMHGHAEQRGHATPPCLVS